MPNPIELEKAKKSLEESRKFFMGYLRELASLGDVHDDVLLSKYWFARHHHMDMEKTAKLIVDLQRPERPDLPRPEKEGE